MMVSQRDLEEAVRAFCPVFYLCNDDSFGHPCSFDFFIQQSRLLCSHPACNRVLVELGSLSPGHVRDAVCESCGSGERLSLQLGTPEAKYGEKDREIDEIPVYAHVKGVRVDGGDAYEALEITYITLFAHNGPYTVFPFVHVGAHDGDIEHITVRVDPTGSRLIGVWYNAHRNHDGCWMAAAEVETDTEGGRLVSYIAKHGHGHYPRQGTAYRHFFLGNDVMKKDIRWSPRHVVLLPTYDVVGDDVSFHHKPASKGSTIPHGESVHQRCTGDAWPNLIKNDPCDWMHFQGYFGTAPSPIAQRWFSEAEPPVSRHPLLRVFLHFWPETLSIQGC